MCIAINHEEGNLVKKYTMHSKIFLLGKPQDEPGRSRRSFFWGVGGLISMISAATSEPFGVVIFEL